MFKLTQNPLLSSLMSRSSVLALSLVGATACTVSSGGVANEMNAGAQEGSGSKSKDKDKEDEDEDDDDDSSDDKDDKPDNSGSDEDDDDGVGPDKEDVTTELTYYRDAKAIIDAKCGNCHKPNDIAPFTLESYKEVYKLRTVVKNSIETGSMPPWSPRDGCWEYKGNRALTAKEKKTLLDWLDGGAPKGDPDDEPSISDKDSTHKVEIDWNMTLEMPEPYTPQGLDDNRCFLVEWPGKKDAVHDCL